MYCIWLKGKTEHFQCAPAVHHHIPLESCCSLALISLGFCRCLITGVRTANGLWVENDIQIFCFGLSLVECGKKIIKAICNISPLFHDSPVSTPLLKNDSYKKADQRQTEKSPLRALCVCHQFLTGYVFDFHQNKWESFTGLLV